MTNPSRANLTVLSLVLIFLLAVVHALPAGVRTAGLTALAAVLAGVAGVVTATKK